MKNKILKLIAIISIIILICEIDKITIGIIIIKLISILYLYLLAKANNYFYQG